MSNIVALGGKHKSASSLLAEIMNDQACKRVVLMTFDGDGNAGFAHFECTRQEMAFASLAIAKHAMNE